MIYQLKRRFKIKKFVATLVIVVLALTFSCSQRTAQSFRGRVDVNVQSSIVTIENTENTLSVKINNELFTEYHFKGVHKPYFYPLIGPNGENITRRWPMEEGENEQHDHKHHRSLWFGHGNVNGHDFWTEKGRIVHDNFLEVSSGEKVGVIKARNKWVAKNGKVICTDIRTMRFFSLSNGNRVMDFDIEIFAPDSNVVFGDTKEGTMAIRVASTMCVDGEVGRGSIENSCGQRNEKQTWGKRAEWCDYYGPVGGDIVGVAIFDHPENPRHPTWWQVRNYGLFAANPFGVHDFEKKPRGTGNLNIPAGKSITFRYRFYFHWGDTKQAKIDEVYDSYVSKPLN